MSMSGDALNSTQFVSSPDTAIEDCVRAFAFIVPLRRPSQFGQLQFHWGNPPPAPEPSTLIRMICPYHVVKRSEKNESPCAGLSLSTLPLLAIGDVHGDFKTKTHFGVLRLGPHVNYLLVGLKYYIGDDNANCAAVLAMASPSRYASERIRCEPRLHKSGCNCGHLLPASLQKNQQISLMIFIRLPPNLYLTQWVA